VEDCLLLHYHHHLHLHQGVKLLRGLRVRLECVLVMAIIWRWHKMLPAELR
jgi:hypothetical protein